MTLKELYKSIKEENKLFYFETGNPFTTEIKSNHFEQSNYHRIISLQSFFIEQHGIKLEYLDSRTEFREINPDGQEQYSPNSRWEQVSFKILFYANQNIIDESFLIKLRQNTNHGRKLYILDEDTANSDFKKVIKELYPNKDELYNFNWNEEKYKLKFEEFLFQNCYNYILDEFMFPDSISNERGARNIIENKNSLVISRGMIIVITLLSIIFILGLILI